MAARRVTAVFVALVGLGAVLMNRRFGRASVASSREFFGINLREGTGPYRFTVWYSRIMAIVVGGTMAVLGLLAAFGVM